MALWTLFTDLVNMQPGKVTYGIQMVFMAHKTHSAIDKLMVSDDAIRGGSPQQRQFLTELLDEVREQGGTANVFSSRAPCGEQLSQMGGCAAILRLPLADDFEENIVIDKNFTESKLVSEFLSHRATLAKERRRKNSSSKDGDDDG
jgi:hypothetical protein